MEVSGLALREIAIFRDVAEGDLDGLAKRCQWRRYLRDQQILGYGDESRDVFFVVSGRVRAINYSIAGKEVSFRDIEGGDMFGEFAAIDSQPRSANVVALEESLIASMSANTFWNVLREQPKVAAATLKRLTAQVRSLTERVFEFSTLAVKNRIHAELLRLARDHMESDNTAVISPAPSRNLRLVATGPSRPTLALSSPMLRKMISNSRMYQPEVEAPTTKPTMPATKMVRIRTRRQVRRMSSGASKPVL